MSKSDKHEQVQRITNAPEPLAADQSHRMKIYVLQMAIRLVCLFLAVLIPGPLRWLFILGAILLPYSAVLLANAGRDRRQTDVVLMEDRQIAGGPQAEPAPGASDDAQAPARPQTQAQAQAEMQAERQPDDGGSGSAPRASARSAPGPEPEAEPKPAPSSPTNAPENTPEKET